MIAYEIKSIIYLTVLFIPYMLLLRKESFFAFNRVMLLVIMVLSLVLPLVNIPSLYVDGNPISHAMRPIIEIGMPVAIAEHGTSASALTTHVDTWSIVSGVIIGGMVMVAMAKAVQLALLLRHIRRGTLWTDHRDGVTLHCHANDVAPFSWFGHIVISQSDYDTCRNEILRHEMSHIVHRHSWVHPLHHLQQVEQHNVP